MVLSPDIRLDVPGTDLLSWLFPDKSASAQTILIDAADDARRLSGWQALSLIRKLIAGLRVLGLARGDVVCLHAFNHILYSSIYLAVIGAGGCIVGSNPGFATIELQHLLQTTKSKYMIIEAGLLDKALPALLAANIPASHVLLFSPNDEPTPTFGLRNWDILLQHGEQDWVCFQDEATARATRAALFLTSGTTTGLPKAAAISHFALVASGVAIKHLESRKPSDVSYLICLPQFHAFAAPLMQLAAFRPGRKMHIMRRFEVSRFVHYLQRYAITDIAVVPHIIATLTTNAAPRHLSTLRSVMSAGSPLPSVLKSKLQTLLPASAIVSQNWGMTEMGWISTLPWPETDSTGTVGRLLPNMEAKVVDSGGLEVMEGSSGELYVKGPSVMTEYLDNTTATGATLKEGWLRTGDLGFVTDGKIYILGRIKDIIKVRGWQVSPSELEFTLLLHPGIVDTAVVGVPNSAEHGGGEVPRAYIVVRPGCHVTEDEAIKFVGSRLAKYKALAGGVVIVPSVPRNDNGKILKNTLFDWSKASMAVNVPV